MFPTAHTIKLKSSNDPQSTTAQCNGHQYSRQMDGSTHSESKFEISPRNATQRNAAKISNQESSLLSSVVPFSSPFSGRKGSP